MWDAQASSTHAGSTHVQLHMRWVLLDPRPELKYFRNASQILQVAWEWVSSVCVFAFICDRLTSDKTCAIEVVPPFEVPT